MRPVWSPLGRGDQICHAYLENNHCKAAVCAEEVRDPTKGALRDFEIVWDGLFRKKQNSGNPTC